MATGIVTQLKMNDVLANLVAKSKTGLAWAFLCKIFPTLKNTEDVPISHDFSTTTNHDLQEVATVLVALNELGRLMQKKLFCARLTQRIALISTGPWMLAQFAAG